MKKNYKMIRVFNVKMSEKQENVVESADYEIIAEFPEFEVEEEYEAKLIELCKNQNIPYGAYTIVEYRDDEPWSAPGQFFYNSPEEIKEGCETFLDCAESNDRIPVEVALGANLRHWDE